MLERLVRNSGFLVLFAEWVLASILCQFCRCWLRNTVGVRRGAVDSVITRIKSGWSKFRDLVPLLVSRGLPLGANGRLCSAFVRSVMLYKIETAKEKDVIRIKRNDARMARWICNIRPEDRISAEELTTKLKFDSASECLQDKRLEPIRHLTVQS